MVRTSLLALGAILFASSTASAQLFPRRQSVVRGSYALIGNALVDCPTAAACDNNTSMLIAVDVDPIAIGDRDGDGNDDTTVSSAATLALPPGAVVQSAFLTVLAGGSETTAGGASWIASGDPADYPIAFAPPESPYVTVTATEAMAGAALVGGGYTAYYDVTPWVTGSGEYWVADAVLAPVDRPYNQNAGWTLLVIYEDGSAPQLVTSYDGGFICYQNTNVLTFDQFRTPAAGTTRAQMALLGVDGHAPTPGESVTLGALVLSNAENPANNIGNSSVSNAQGPIPRNPASLFVTESIDIDTFDVSSAFTNSQTSIAATFTCGPSDGFVYFGAVLAMDVLFPEVTLVKTVVDVDGGDLVPGDELQYEIQIDVSGGDDAIDFVLRDPIPDGTTYLAGSIEVGTSSRTDALDGDNAEFMGGEVIARLGMVTVNSSEVVRFRVTVDTTTAARSIDNVASATLRGAQAGSGLAELEVTSTSTDGAGPTSIVAVPCEGFMNGACPPPPDAGVETDAGSEMDAALIDTGADAGTPDTGAADSGSTPDSGLAKDSGVADAGTMEEDGGCDCTTAASSSDLAWLGLAALVFWFRRRRG
jgi:large repetitive protein